MSPIMAANTLTISLHYGRNFTDVALLTGYHLLGVGAAGVLCVPTARIWGKRHLFLLGNVLMIISCAWAGGSGKNYHSLLAARIFQGFALAPFEALVNACVGDLYFVHVSQKLMFPKLSPEISADMAVMDRNVESEWHCRTWLSLVALF
jgi:MFS family permease